MRPAVQGYLLLIGTTIIAIAIILKVGAGLPLGSTTVPSAKPASASSDLTSSPPETQTQGRPQLRHGTKADPLTRLLLQLVVIIGVCYAIGSLFSLAGQPAVVGEMMAGILLGPSLFGWVAPSAFQTVFAPNSLEPLHLLSQIGVCLFMFAVGMELDLSQIWKRAERVLVIGHGGIAIPFLLGVGLALPLYRPYASAGASFSAFALFMGISMSITAFPMLVRILKDRDLFQTTLGKTATMCAALGDATAWCILAIVIAIAGATNVGGAFARAGAAIGYAAFMFVLMRPLLARLLRPWLKEEVDPEQPALVLVSALVLTSALVTERIGLHALFGAFLAGIIMPGGGGFREKLTIRVEQFSSVLLLPMFFAFIGLRTQVALLTNGFDWIVCGLIVLVATVGKMGGTAIICRGFGQNWREALALGALMNTRGLMELIALNVGLEMGILSMRVFTMLVLMAIITTVLTGPLVQWLTRPLTAPVNSGLRPKLSG